MAPLTECGAVDVRDQNMIYSKLLIIIIYIYIYTSDGATSGRKVGGWQ